MTAESPMRKKTKYTAGEVGRVCVVEDFLPSAKKLTKRKNKAATTRMVGYTDAELRAMQQRGESKSDFKKAATIPLPSGDDPDDAMEDIGWATTEPPLPRRKTRTTMRLS